MKVMIGVKRFITSVCVFYPKIYRKILISLSQEFTFAGVRYLNLDLFLRCFGLLEVSALQEKSAISDIAYSFYARMGLFSRLRMKFSSVHSMTRNCCFPKQVPMIFWQYLISQRICSTFRFFSSFSLNWEQRKMKAFFSSLKKVCWQLGWRWGTTEGRNTSKSLLRIRNGSLQQRTNFLLGSFAFSMCFLWQCCRGCSD